MTTYQPYLDFTAQARSVHTLSVLQARLLTPEGYQGDLLLAMVVFTAFAIEGYLNSLGSRTILYWDDLERLPWKQKVSILHKHHGATLVWGKDPLQFAKQIFDLRDKLAHGKPERVKGPVFATSDEAHAHHQAGLLEPDWYRAITVEWMHKAKSRFDDLATYLGDLCGMPKGDPDVAAYYGVLTND